MAGQESGRGPEWISPAEHSPAPAQIHTDSENNVGIHDAGERAGALASYPSISTERIEQVHDEARGPGTRLGTETRRGSTLEMDDCCIMGVLISHHDQLAMSKLVERPVLRVHVVDALTGDYLQRPGMSTGRFPSERQQQEMLDAPGHDTMTTVYDDACEAFTTILSYVPATQTQELPTSAASKASGKFVWQEELHIDHPFKDTVLNPQAGALVLFELLQHPSSVRQWHRNGRDFAGATHRVAWAFLDLAHPQTRRATSGACTELQPAVLDLQLHQWPGDLKQRELADAAQCGDVHEAFLRLQEDAEGRSLRRPWRPRSAAAGAGAPRRGGLADSRGPTLRVTLRPVPRPQVGPEMLTAALQTTRSRARTCLPAGFGSGWDNYRGDLGENLTSGARADTRPDASVRRSTFFAAVRRQPAEACRVPDMLHEALLPAPAAAAGAGAMQHPSAAAVLRSSRASVLAFSPCGTCLAAAVEDAPQQWLLRVFDVATGAVMPPGSVHAHKALVYGLCWSADGRVVASCSSDCTARVWYLEAAADHAAATRGHRRAASAGLPFCTVLHHPSYVYTCLAHPNTCLPDRVASGGTAALLLVTGCADGALRFWGLRGDVDARAEPDGSCPLLQLHSGPRPGPSMPRAAINAALWDGPGDQEGVLATASAPFTVTAGSTRTGSAHSTQHGVAADLSAPILFTGDDSGTVAAWAVDVRGVCRGAGGAVRRVASTSVGAAVTCLTSAAHTVKLAVVTRASRIIVLHKRTLQPVMALEGLRTVGLLGGAAMDPSRGRWLLAGAEDGRLYCFSLSPPVAGAGEVVLPSMQADIAPGAAPARGPPVYCVAWSPTMHVAAVCSRHTAGYTTLLCSKAGTAFQRQPPVFKPYAPKHSQRRGDRTARGAPADTHRAAPARAVAAGYSAAKYRLPEEVDVLYVKALLARIRSDLHGRGLLDSPDAPLTRYTPAAQAEGPAQRS